MGLHSKKDFAKMCGMKTGHLTTYISRGKVVQRADDKMIDDAVGINSDFLSHRRETQVDKIKSGADSPGKTPTSKPKNPDAPELFDDPPDEYTTLQNRKARADLNKKLIDIKSATLGYQILKGKHIPTEMVRDVIMELGKSILTNYKDAADAILTEFAHRTALSSTDFAEMKGVLVENLNTAHHKAITAAGKQVVAIVSDFKKENKLNQDASESK